MSNVEILTSIISIILTIVSTVLAIMSKKNSRAKTYYETIVKVEEELKNLCIVAENNYIKGEQKKKYVITGITRFINQNNFYIEPDKIENIIESIIDLSKKINK